MMEKYGDEAKLSIHIAESIEYHFFDVKGKVNYSEVGKIIETTNYFILSLNNGVSLPIWKIGFTQGTWAEFVPYFKQHMKTRS